MFAEQTINPDVIIDEEGVEYLLLSAAIKLLPGTQAGKKVHLNTAHRMIRDGRLKGKYRQVGTRRYWYVRKDQIQDAARLTDPEKEMPVADNRELDRFTREQLADMNGVR